MMACNASELGAATKPIWDWQEFGVAWTVSVSTVVPRKMDAAEMTDRMI